MSIPRLTSDTHVLTTGQIGTMCGVSQRTVAKWIDDGLLPASRIPGSRDRRIRVEDMIRFMRENRLPLAPPLFEDECVLIHSGDGAVGGRIYDIVRMQLACRVFLATTPIEAGLLAGRYTPSVIIVVHDPSQPLSVYQNMVERSPESRTWCLIALAASEGDRQLLRSMGYVYALPTAGEPSHLIQALALCGVSKRRAA